MLIAKATWLARLCPNPVVAAIGSTAQGHAPVTRAQHEQIVLHLTGRARAVAADVQRHAAALPKNDGRGALAEVVLREAAGRLSVPLGHTARCTP